MNMHLRRRKAEQADFLRRMQRLDGLVDPVPRKLLSNHDAVAEEWFCDAFAHWAAGTLPEPHVAFFDRMLAGVFPSPDTTNPLPLSL
ncbi:carbohydrate kinase family protein [Azospirillum canadense]|uniref:hypothetical protein n=1 Tax=Azospirillum canadense TaxID=403962 RepID=UPI002225FD3A|nr:hypothetical protein [Azospirillum canadense]MCW2242723.1 hypothetical protein [Azospirillum canadense]